MASKVSTYAYYNKDGKKLYGYRFEIAPKVKEVEKNGKTELRSVRQWESKRTGCTKESDAQRLGIEAQLQYENHGKTKDGNIALDTFFAEWLKAINYELQEATINSYSKRIRLYISPAIGKYRLKSITDKDLQDLMNALYDSGLSVNTLVSIKGILTKSFNYAKQEGYFTSSPATDIKIPVRPRKETKLSTKRESAQRGNKTRDVIPDDQIEAIFNRFKEGDSTYIPLMLAYKCGLRLGEAYAVTWEDIDFEARTININKQAQYSDSGYWFFTLPKYRSIRKIAIDKELCELLKREKEKQYIQKTNNIVKQKGVITLIPNSFDTTKIGDSYKDKNIPNFHYRIYETGINNSNIDNGLKAINLVCTRYDGSYINPRTMQHASRIIHYDLGFEDFDFHSLRHTHTSKLVEVGANLKYIQTRLGHKNLKVTLQIYTHLTEKMQTDGDKLIDNLFN